MTKNTPTPFDGAHQIAANLSCALDVVRLAPTLPDTLGIAMAWANVRLSQHDHLKFDVLANMKAHASPSGYFAPVAEAFTRIATQALDVDESHLLHPARGEHGPISSTALHRSTHIFNTLSKGVAFASYGRDASPQTIRLLHNGFDRLYEMNGGQLKSSPTIDDVHHMVDSCTNPAGRSRATGNTNPLMQEFIATRFEPIRSTALKLNSGIYL